LRVGDGSRSARGKARRFSAVGGGGVWA